MVKYGPKDTRNSASLRRCTMARILLIVTPIQHSTENDTNIPMKRTSKGVRYLVNYIRDCRPPLIPIGTVKALYVYPVKSCKGTSVFSMYCGEMGPVSGEMHDRQFIVVNGKTGLFYTGRQKPRMVLIDCEVHDGLLTMALDGRSVRVNLDEVVKRKEVKTARLFHNERSDGLDCGDDVAAFLSDVLQEPDTRLLMYVKGLYTERGCKTTRTSWNTEVSRRNDKTAFADDAPFMIMSQTSLEKLNEKLSDKVTIERFRPVILVDQSTDWDEDKWLSVHIGDTALQCLKPCFRCVMTTIHPTSGTMDPSVEPLRTLRSFRLAPEGPLRDEHKESPMFGVDAGVITPFLVKGSFMAAAVENYSDPDTVPIEMCLKVASILRNPLYRAFQIINLLESVAAVILIVFVVSRHRRKLPIHKNIEILLTTLFLACLCHAVTYTVAKIYQLQLSFFTENPCHLFLPQAFYIITHTLISYSNHMQVVMVVERIVATVWVDTYEKQCRALGAVLLIILLLLTALETVGSIGDNFAEVLMTNSLMVTDSTASDVTAAFAVIFVICCVTLLINISQYCFNLHRKKR
ncbi:MOSC beta barrel domain protein [Teladorsagia circumcincta]|uniref:MOSC beta barrel domain protein n=1 Tax=Teladorsagia circumcincta TaxID=45464 RepID=A0A2G9USJ9_TELCI|nr:MOSC beta barrel domain protein [Teladorsagia circumcincta]